MSSQSGDKINADILAIPAVIRSPVSPGLDLVIALCLNGVVQQEGCAKAFVIGALVTLVSGRFAVAFKKGIKRKGHGKSLF